MVPESQKSILIVDDDPDDVFLISEAIADIEHGYYGVEHSSSASAALEQIASGQFDVIISDYQLGPTTGIELIGAIRARGINTPVILLTGMSNHAIDEEALRAGASDYISKSSLTPPIIDRAIRYAIANAQRQELVSSVLSNVKAAICVVGDDARPEIWNAEFLSLAQDQNADCEEEMAVGAFADTVMSSDRIHIGTNKTHEKNVTVLPDGRSVVMLHDVTEHINALRERERAENKAAHQAKHCFLTGLPNRMALAEKLERLIADGIKFDLLTVDLIKFKEVNDVFGHPVGDQLLQRVAQKLRRCCNEEDYLARIGGDEFVAIQIREGDQTESRLADGFLKVLDARIALSERKLKVGASIGVASFPEHGSDSDSLLSNADIAMYRVKDSRGSGIQYYNSDLDKSVRDKRRLATDLQIAIREDGLDVYFQPQYDLASGKLIGCEALARWMHPEDGPISPDFFIELAEESGLIEELGTLVLRKACTIAADWPQPLKVAVNISGVQVRHTDLVTTIRSVLFETGLAANRLELEVTETVLLDDLDYALHVLRGIKNLGVGLAMDDFGTGFSSLSSLISFPFDKLKIDRSFVSDMDSRTQLKSVIKTCIGLGKNLNLRIVAEGVEQQSHIDFLREVSCDEVQGFFVGKPMPNVALLEFMDVYSNGWAERVVEGKLLADIA